MMLNLADNLIRLRLELRLSRRAFSSQFSEDIKVDALISVDNVGNWERGHSQPSLQALKAIASYYGTTIDKLCFSTLRLKIHDSKASTKTSQARGGAGPKAGIQDFSDTSREATVLPHRNVTGQAQTKAA